MTIQTKFDPGDEVFVVLPVNHRECPTTKVRKMVVRAIKFKIGQDKVPLLLYTVQTERSRMTLQVTEAGLHAEQTDAQRVSNEEACRLRQERQVARGRWHQPTRAQVVGAERARAERAEGGAR